MHTSIINNPKALHNMTWIPIFLIGLVILIAGIGCLIGFNSGNVHIDSNRLQSGLGLGIFGICLMIFVQKTRLGTRVNRVIPQALLVILLFVVYLNMDGLLHVYLVWTIFVITLFLVTSIIASQRLNKFD
jgi:hypothetical protein